MTLLLIAAALALAPASTPLDLSLDASDAAAGRPGPSIAAGFKLTSPLTNLEVTPLTGPIVLDVTAAIGRDCRVDVCVAPPKLSTNASLAFVLGPVDARIGTTLEGPQVMPRLDTSLTLGFLAVETDGASVIRLLASFEL